MFPCLFEYESENDCTDIIGSTIFSFNISTLIFPCRNFEIWLSKVKILQRLKPKDSLLSKIFQFLKLNKILMEPSPI